MVKITNFLWFYVSPQDENFQGKPAKPLFLINLFRYNDIGFMKKEKEGNLNKKIVPYLLRNKTSFTTLFAGFFGDESDEKNLDDFGLKLNHRLR